MLVHPDFRRRGIATALMKRSLSYLDDKVECVKLDATPEGLLVYEQLGFTSEWKFHRWEIAADQLSQAVRPNSLTPRNDELDAIAFGTDRSTLLNRLEEVSLTVVNENGFGMIRSGRRAAYLGPVTAATPACAEQIIRQLLAAQVGRVFWDIPGPNVAARMIAEQLGFRPVRELTRMTLRQMKTMPNLMLQFAITSPETG